MKDEYTREEEMDAQMAIQTKTMSMWSDFFENHMPKIIEKYARDICEKRNAECMRILYSNADKHSRGAPKCD